jgi:RNA exonuclease 4
VRPCTFSSCSHFTRHIRPGKYLAVDCEMVGVGPTGEESSLARVSMVNYHGAVQLDIFVKQREQVTDYRTAVSGIHPHNVSSSSTAVTFAEAQKRVAELIKDRVLIGHAIENDLKALLLSQPRTLVRDTQKLAKKSRLLGGSRWPGLKKLIQKEFDVMIQAGQHDSVCIFIFLFLVCSYS